MKFSVNRMVKLGMLSALGVVLMLLVRFPIFPSAAFLEYDAGDVPAIIGTFLYGPAAGFIITVIVSAIQASTVSAASGWVGFVMHVGATGVMVIAAGLIYKKMHTFKGAIIAMAVGSLGMTAVMAALNLLLTTRFLNVPVEAVKAMLLPIIIPFNLIKSFANSAVTTLVYKSAGRLLRTSGDRAAKRV